MFPELCADGAAVGVQQIPGYCGRMSDILAFGIWHSVILDYVL
jgi:hypothetical protein